MAIIPSKPKNNKKIKKSKKKKIKTSKNKKSFTYSSNTFLQPGARGEFISTPSGPTITRSNS